jgi:hypothetical protein
MATDGQVWSAHIFIETSALYRNSTVASVVLSNPCITSVFSDAEEAFVLVETKYYRYPSHNKICCLFTCLLDTESQKVNPLDFLLKSL